jgi:hypothetical protein
MSILEQIKANAITELVLSQDADEISEDVATIIDGLKHNKSIVSIRLEGDFLGLIRNDFRVELLEAIGLIPTLKKVHLGDALLLVPGIAKMLCLAYSLCELSLYHVVLQGIEDDFSTLEAALHSHPSLKIFNMDECIPAHRDISLENLTKSAAKLSTISSPLPNQKTAQTA